MSYSHSITNVLDDLNIATQEYMKELVRVVSSDNYLNKRLLSKSEAVDGGDFIKVPLRYGTENFAGMSEYDAISLAPKDIMDEARYNWVHLNGNISLSEKKMKVQNAGRRKLLNLVKVRMQNLADTFKDGMSDMLFKGDAKSYDSLTSIVATQNNVIGGIDANDGTLPYDWNPKVTAVAQQSSATPTFQHITTVGNVANIQTLLRNLVSSLTIGSDSPSLILVPQVIWDAYEQVLADQKRFDANYVADGGFDVLKFRHVDVAVDNHVQGGSLDPNSSSTSSMYAINEDYMGFYHASGFNMKNTPWKRAEMQHVFFTELDWYGGLCVSRRDMQGAVTGLPTSY